MKQVETVTNYTCDYCKTNITDASSRVSVNQFDHSHFCKRCIYLFILAAQKAINFTWEEWLLKMALVENTLRGREDIH